MLKEVKRILIDKINGSAWWHVPPRDPDAYTKRGKFFSSAFAQAEFYGRPNDIPEKVTISNPVYGFSEKEILRQLFPNNHKKLLRKVVECKKERYQARVKLDANMFQKARVMGYDAIVLMGRTGRKQLESNRKPRSIELNLLYP